MVSIEDFKKLEIKVAKVLEVNLHPGADRLYVLKVLLGNLESKDEITGEIVNTPEVREVVAGIRPYYTPEELVGKQVIVLVNLEPATIRGVQSNGMVLATKDNDKLSILTVDRPAPEGSIIS
ncbi:MAG: methionine--tRNA ligase subunit beta [Candidatus Omnitrophica bacterium]|nr:methionine--tRNA ligase subunit beta [Candidatus Omnitrophota bacterium]